MIINEVDLPGIGRRFECITSRGDKLVAVIHDEDGKVVTYIAKNYKEDEDEVFYDFDLSDSEARQFAGIIGGMAYQPVKQAEKELLLSDDFGIRWCEVRPNSVLIGNSVLDSDIKSMYGILIIAIIRRDGSKILNPGPSTLFKENDTIVVSGDLKKIKQLIHEKLNKERT